MIYKNKNQQRNLEIKNNKIHNSNRNDILSKKWNPTSLKNVLSKTCVSCYEKTLFAIKNETEFDWDNLSASCLIDCEKQITKFLTVWNQKRQIIHEWGLKWELAMIRNYMHKLI